VRRENGREVRCVCVSMRAMSEREREGERMRRRDENAGEGEEEEGRDGDRDRKVCENKVRNEEIRHCQTCPVTGPRLLWSRSHRLCVEREVPATAAVAGGLPPARQRKVKPTRLLFRARPRPCQGRQNPFHRSEIADTVNVCSYEVRVQLRKGSTLQN
jgi:hypothetical protein